MHNFLTSSSISSCFCAGVQLKELAKTAYSAPRLVNLCRFKHLLCGHGENVEKSEHSLYQLHMVALILLFISAYVELMNILFHSHHAI